MHQQMAATLDAVVGEIRGSRRRRGGGGDPRPRWPMIVLRSPKGWTCPRRSTGSAARTTGARTRSRWAEIRGNPEHVRILEAWLKSYGPEELFDATGRLVPELAEIAPRGERRMSANPHANGGLLLKDLRLPDFREYAVDVPEPGATTAEATRVMGTFLRDVMRDNLEARNFRLFSPDESNSNRWQDVSGGHEPGLDADIYPFDDHLAPDGRVMEMLSEHQCQGWLEGYLLTGRHGSSRATRRSSTSSTRCSTSTRSGSRSATASRGGGPSRRSTTCSRRTSGARTTTASATRTRLHRPRRQQEGRGRPRLPAARRQHAPLRDGPLPASRNYVNVVVAGKQPAPQWLTMDEAVKHCTAGIGIWEWASNDADGEPDVVMACCGDVPTLETLAAVDLLRKHLPELKVRVVNVVDLMTLQPQTEHPHGLSDADFDALFTKDRPVVFAFHGYPR
jgi:xylulose-5-phosphate/fructose-6-phosphate phosphoketolase